MEYAIQLLIPMLAGLCLGSWLTRHYHASPIWTLALGLLGFALGIGVLAKKSLLNTNMPKLNTGKKTSDIHASTPSDSGSHPSIGAESKATLEAKGRFIEKSTGIMPHEMDFLYQDYSHESDDQPYDFSDRDDEQKL